MFIENKIFEEISFVIDHNARPIRHNRFVVIIYLVLGTETDLRNSDVNDKASGSKEPGSSQESVNLDSKKDTAKGAKTMAELDNELRERLENTSGEGGVAGLEYENGKPVAMRRSVRNNMFRYI